MAGLNKVILMGNLVADPEYKTTPSGVGVTTFRIAVGRRFVKQGDEVVVTAEGADEDAAIAALKTFFENNL